MKRPIRLSAMSLLAIPLLLVRYSEGQEASDRDFAAEFTDAGALIFPAGTDQWITLGAGIGSDYSSDFDPGNAGPITVAQMEPNAYEYFEERGEYADGTLLLLSFYATQEKPEPQLNGFVQGALLSREIHLIDKRNYEDGRAFFVFPGDSTDAVQALPPGNECVRCHEEHGGFDGTFAQFYPVIRGLLDGRSE